MEGLRRAMWVLGLVLLPSIASAQGVVFREDFESGAANWTFQALWHLESDTSLCGAQLAPFPSPGHCAWYGSTPPGTSGCNYEQGPYSSAALTLNTPVSLPAGAGSIALRYRRFLATEGCTATYDSSFVIVRDSGGALLMGASDCGGEGGWCDRRVDLSAFAGVPVRLSFSFAAMDGVWNSTLGWWIDDVEIVAEPGTVTCTAGPVCPCTGQWHDHGLQTGPHANEDSGGCGHSSFKEARLFGNGVQSVAADSVELVIHDLPAGTIALYAQGLNNISITFGDGRRCVGGTVVRLAVHTVANGQDAYPRVGEPGVALKGSVPAGGGTRTYQVVYRDAAAFCTPSTFNTSNAYVIAWLP